jgi:hypothetical protein
MEREDVALYVGAKVAMDPDGTVQLLDVSIQPAKE